VLLLLRLTGPLASAQTAPQDFRTFVTLHIDTIDEGETAAIVRGDDVLIPISALEQASVHGLKGRREALFGDTYVSLASLAPDVTFKFDVDALALEITIAPQLLNTTTSVDLRSARPAHIEYTSGSSAYLNYALAGVSGGADSAFFDAGLVHAQDSFHFSLTALSNNPLRRGLTYYEMDNRVTEVSRVAGDLNAASGDLGGTAYVGGIGISRNFNLDPYAIHFPLPTLSGLITSPSIANVYVNGVLVQRVNLPPGSFNLNNLPVVAGSANAQVVVTDAFGRSQSYSQNYYTVPSILTPGTTDFRYAAGLLRQNAFSQGDAYGPGAVLGSYRIGVTNAITAGGRFEATPQLVSGGPSIDFKTGLGFFHVAAAGSDMQGFLGAAASIGYSYVTSHIGLGLSYLAQGPYYANVSQSVSADRTISALSPSATISLGRSGGSLTLQYFRRAMRDSGANDEIVVSDTIPVRRGTSLTVAADRVTSTTAAPLVNVTATLNFGVGRTAASIFSQTGSTRDSNVQIQQPSPGRYGLGYTALYDPSSGHALDGSLLYASQYGNLDADYSRSSTAAFSDSVRLAGSLTFIGGHVFPTQPVTGSYALVDVPGTPGVHVFLENQDMGKTNAHGELLVPNLLSNYGNTLRIDDENAAINSSIQSLQRIIAPPAQAGAVVKFEAERLLALTGTLRVMLHGATVVPQYGDLTLYGKSDHFESALGLDGEFYLENVPSGAYRAHAVFKEGTCDFDFQAPDTSAMLVKLGTLTCTAS